MTVLRNGSVVLFASVAGFTPFLDLGLYGVAQTAILGMTKASVVWGLPGSE